MDLLRRSAEKRSLLSPKSAALAVALSVMVSCGKDATPISAAEVERQCNKRAQIMAAEALKAWEISAVAQTATAESCQLQHISGTNYKMHSYGVAIKGKIENCVLGFNVTLRPGKQAPIISALKVNDELIDYGVPAALPNQTLSGTEFTVWQILRTKSTAATAIRSCAPSVVKLVESVPGTPLETSRPPKIA